MQTWLGNLFQAITAFGILFGIWTTIKGNRATAAVAREAAAHAMAAVVEIKNVADKVEEVHIATNSMKDALVATTALASDAVGERRGIEIGRAAAEKEAEDRRNPPGE